MTTMQIESRKANLLPFLALALVLAVLFLAVSAPSRHAVTGHGANAYSVTQRFKRVDPDDDDVWSRTCQDGRKYTFRMLHNNDGKFAVDVSIDDPITGENITRFTTTSKNWVARKLRLCE